MCKDDHVIRPFRSRTGPRPRRLSTVVADPQTIASLTISANANVNATPHRTAKKTCHGVLYSTERTERACWGVRGNDALYRREPKKKKKKGGGGPPSRSFLLDRSSSDRKYTSFNRQPRKMGAARRCSRTLRLPCTAQCRAYGRVQSISRTYSTCARECRRHPTYVDVCQWQKVRQAPRRPRRSKSDVKDSSLTALV